MATKTYDPGTYAWPFLAPSVFFKALAGWEGSTSKNGVLSIVRLLIRKTHDPADWDLATREVEIGSVCWCREINS
jgi:hypothetical protein